ncbi:hypothetical protein SLA2020_028170 [Shorea laevis]
MSTTVRLLALCFYLLTCFCMTMAMATDSVQLNDDVLGLMVFKSDLQDPSSYLRSWIEDDDTPCSWRFVRCNPVTARVSELSLDGLGLSGKISGRGLQKLQHLKVLSLSRNNFTGNISPELGLIHSLQTLNLSQNSLSGPIPTSFVLNSIRFLDLSGNSLSGPIPNDLFRNCSLNYLSLSRNSLQGSLPTTLTRCSSLNTLKLSNNHFSGSPDFASASGIWSMNRLRVLDLSNNQFSGALPLGMFNLHNLKQLLLQGNRFFGPLPPDMGLCPHLTTFNLSHNLFSGELPESLHNLNSLTWFSLSNNVLTGELPLWIGNLSSLQHLDLSSNSIAGSLPWTIGNLKSLNYLSLSRNNLTGNIPTSLAYCSELSVIRLRDNGLNGSIPDALFQLGLEEVDFSLNGLTGPIPPVSSRLIESLQVLDLSRNKLKDHIPAEMANIRFLNLSWNNLHIKFPPGIGCWRNLTVLDLQNTALYGAIPNGICDSGSLTILQLDGNSLTGPIPDEIGNCSSLSLLSLSHNNLSGSIPKSVSNLSKLKILKLELNELSGDMPVELGKLGNLLAVNISHNRLTGRLPVGGIFQSLDASAMEGNLGICSPLLKEPCKMNVPKPLVLDPFANKIPSGRTNRTSSTFHHRTFLSVSAIIAISAAILITSGVIVISLLNVSVRRRLAFVDKALESMCSTSSSSSRFGNLQAGKFILFDSSSDWINCKPESLLQKAAEIGGGVFGTVYKVSLGDGRMVAIKKLVTSDIIQYPEDFDREVRVLGKARHPNLISLLGYHWIPQLQLLVSEYAPYGNLQTRLHQRQPSTAPLSWANRFKIILGTAKGLAHLHHSFRPPIVHYNIKPSNILVDENCNPKISDYGLARLLSLRRLEKHVMSNRFQGAAGYVAPELACQSLRVTEKCDVYGFGVLMMELVSGRRAVEYGDDNVMILSEQVRVMVEQGNVLDCVDRNMGDYPEDHVLPVLKLALVCTSHIPSSRPSMAEIVQILQVIRTPLPHTVELF